VLQNALAATAAAAARRRAGPLHLHPAVKRIKLESGESSEVSVALSGDDDLFGDDKGQGLQQVQQQQVQQQQAAQ
jgi:hypothetical protein